MAFIRKNTDIVRGDELWLFIGTTKDQEMPTCFATQHSLSRTMSTNTVSSKDHGNTSYVIPGEGSWTCSTEALMSIASGDEGHAMAFDDMMEAFSKGDYVYVKFGKLVQSHEVVGKGIVNVDNVTEWTLAEPYWSGMGYITSLQASGGHGDSATFSIEITGIGPLDRNPQKTPGPQPPEPGEHDISMSYVGGNEVTAAELEENIITNQSTASSGDDVTITPADVTNKKYFAPYISCTANNGTPEWDAEHKYWTLTMPDDDVTITLSDTTKYRALVHTSSRSFDYEGIYGEYRTKFPAGANVHVVPDDTSFPLDSYLCNVSYIVGGTTIQFTPNWNSSYAYWYFTMPAYDVTTRVYHYNDIISEE